MRLSVAPSSYSVNHTETETFCEPLKRQLMHSSPVLEENELKFTSGINVDARDESDGDGDGDGHSDGEDRNLYCGSCCSCCFDFCHIKSLLNIIVELGVTVLVITITTFSVSCVCDAVRSHVARDIFFTLCDICGLKSPKRLTNDTVFIEYIEISETKTC
uniref:Uncharacterized protein n=1 Tax=Glossina brevipalpis TaxID=37001 RepID=A0A1A9W1L0_9MUSC